MQGLVTGGEVARGVCVLCQDDGASGHQRINDGHCCRCRGGERDESNVNVELRMNERGRGKDVCAFFCQFGRIKNVVRDKTDDFSDTDQPPFALFTNLCCAAGMFCFALLCFAHIIVHVCVLSSEFFLLSLCSIPHCGYTDNVLAKSYTNCSVCYLLFVVHGQVRLVFWDSKSMLSIYYYQGRKKKCSG